jgi:peptide/nickel transport system substrate-binding protein
MSSPPNASTPRLGRVGLATAVALAVACAPPAAERGTVVYASGADLESANPLVTIHPLARQVQRYALFVTLTRLDDALKPQPYFARRWSWSGDRRILTLQLLGGLRWHDGVPTSAHDVVFTLETARDPGTGFPRASELAAVERVTAPDDSTVVITFRTAPPGFPLLFSELPIVPRHRLQDVAPAALRRHEFATAPVGNGPFRFTQRDPGRRWRFDRVADFPAQLGGPPSVERLVIAVVDEPTTKFAGLVSGDLDIAGIAPTMAALVDADPALRVVSYPVSFATALIFNTSRPPFDDPRVRRAVDALLDRQRILDVALAGFGAPAAGPVSEDHPWFASIPRITPELADVLLDEAGWRRGPDGRRTRDGTVLGFTLLTVGSGDNAIEQLVQADLRAHGIAVALQLAEFGAFLTMARASPKRFDVLLTGVSGDLSLSHLAGLFDGALAGGALDYGGYHTPRLDSLFAHTRTAASEGETRAAWVAVQRELALQVPASWIYHARGVQGVSRRLEGIRMDLRGELATLGEWRIRGAGGGSR